MIFAMMEKSTFDKTGIKRHEVASEFLTLNSEVSVIYRQAFLEKNEAGVNPLPMTCPRHFLNNEQGEHTFSGGL